MKSLCTATVAMMLAAFTGCNSGTPGGPGTTEPESKKHFYDVGSTDNTFTLSVPSSLPLMSTSLKQGGTAKVTIAIKRGKNFDQDVTLKFEGLPTGVTIDQASAAIKHDQTEANLTLTATDTAALGDFEIKVVGHPTTGGDATNTFKITVDKEATFTVSASIDLHQARRDEGRLDQHQARERTSTRTSRSSSPICPRVLTLDPASPVIKHGDTEAKLMLKSEDDAAVGRLCDQGDGTSHEGPRCLARFQDHRGQEVTANPTPRVETFRPGRAIQFRSEAMCNSRIIGLVILAVGVTLLIFGINASHSVSERIVEGFTGRYTDQTTWYLMGGIAAIVGGAAVPLRRPLLDEVIQTSRTTRFLFWFSAPKACNADSVGACAIGERVVLDAHFQLLPAVTFAGARLGSSLRLGQVIYGFALTNSCDPAALRHRPALGVQ